MYKSFYLFHKKSKQNFNFEKIHLMLITVDNVYVVTYSRYNNHFYFYHDFLGLKFYIPLIFFKKYFYVSFVVSLTVQGEIFSKITQTVLI